ncbi:MAG: glycosyltransferase family 4 protein [Acetobacteraceae bacterium]|nr:glycosyltransferase family 4 protein [Acetobacteraceae bacterium]
MPDGLAASPRLLMTTDAVGGVWRYSLDLTEGMGARPVLAVLGPSPSAAQRDEAAGLGLTLIDTGLPLDWTADDPAALNEATAALQDLAAERRVASVHLHAPALAGAWRWPMPVVAVAHSCVATWWEAVRGGPLPADLAWRTEATRTGLRTADAVVAPTRAHGDAVRRLYGDVPVTVVHNGTRQPLGLARAQAAPSVLTAGRLWDDGKNAAALDRVAPRLGVPVRAAGPIEGPHGARIDLPNLQHLGTLGPDGMGRAFAEATVFASLARYEPFGLSVLEAARAGLRLVLSDIPSFRELWDGVARFVPDGSDPVPALRAALADTGDGGAAERAGHYGVAAMVEGTLAVHRRVGARV